MKTCSCMTRKLLQNSPAGWAAGILSQQTPVVWMSFDSEKWLLAQRGIAPSQSAPRPEPRRSHLHVCIDLCGPSAPWLLQLQHKLLVWRREAYSSPALDGHMCKSILALGRHTQRGGSLLWR